MHMMKRQIVWGSYEADDGICHCFAFPGMLVMLVLHSRFFGFLLLVLCMIAGYYLFCCDD